MNCPICDKEIEITDTTYSNIDIPRAKKGQHTGDIYWREDCQQHFIKDFLLREIRRYLY